MSKILLVLDSLPESLFKGNFNQSQDSRAVQITEMFCNWLKYKGSLLSVISLGTIIPRYSTI